MTLQVSYADRGVGDGPDFATGLEEITLVGPDGVHNLYWSWQEISLSWASVDGSWQSCF